MNKIAMKAYGKINLSIDVLGTLENGYHEVEMVMQQVLLHDDILIRWFPDKRDRKDKNQVEIQLSTNKYYLPRDQRNLAYKAALVMIDNFGDGKNGRIRIDIKKRIPVAAGLGGGSSNAAAVIHGLNKMWELNLSVKELCKVGEALGADVPFAIMGQAKANKNLELSGDPLATHCAIARGTGTQLEPIAKGLNSYVVLIKPPISVSTPIVYKGIDEVEIPSHPDGMDLIKGLLEEDQKRIEKNMINVLENFTLKRYPIAMYTKNKVIAACAKSKVLMSGSGPTIFALCKDEEEAQGRCKVLSSENEETFWTRATF
ncbi:MAG: 4-(cytidine 5'-diphospho)-2-C-methyl-D-erythritol kinase [Anaerovoracaceae bacterium]